MILAAGLGSRLFPLTLFRCKPAVPFLNRPLIEYALELLRAAGVGEIAVNTHHLPDSIRNSVSEALQKRPASHPTLEVAYFHEPEILGTAGAIGHARPFLEGETCIVCNGKIYFEEDLKAALDFHRRQGAAATLVLVPERGTGEFNPVFIDPGQRICGFGPWMEATPEHRPCTFTGVQILEPEILGRFPARPADSVRDVYHPLLQEDSPLFGFLSKAYWTECSTPARYLDKSLEVLRRRALRNLMPGESGEGCRHTIAPPSTQLGENVSLSEVILWEGVQVGAGSSLSRVIAADGVTLPPDTRLSNSIVTPRPETFDSRMGSRGKIQDNLLIWPL